MSLIAKEFGSEQILAVMARIDPESDEAVSRRCRLLRVVYKDGISQSAFSEWLGVGYQRWNNVENGFPLSRDLEQKLLRKIPGLTREWLRENDARRMNLELAQRLSDAEEKAKIG